MYLLPFGLAYYNDDVVRTECQQSNSAIMEQVSEMLKAICRGEQQVADQLLPAVYNDLRRLAESKLAQEPPGQTLLATALVHEGYCAWWIPTNNNGIIAVIFFAPRLKPCGEF